MKAVLKTVGVASLALVVAALIGAVGQMLGLHYLVTVVIVLIAGLVFIGYFYGLKD